MLIFCASLWMSCEEPEGNNSVDPNPDSHNYDTFDQDLDGAILQDNLFFNFEHSLDYLYDYYSVDGIGYSNTIESNGGYECSLRETDIMSYYTFPEYLIEAFNCDPGDGMICSDDDTNYEVYINESLLDETYGGICSCWCIDSDENMVDCNSQDAVAKEYQASPPITEVCQNSAYTTQGDCDMNGWIWFNETIDCSIMDANQDCEMVEAQELNLINTESVDFSATYTNVEKMYWDVESDPPKYKTQVSVDQVLEETITDESDTYDASIYWTIINEWDAENIDGMIYIDHAQWNDTTLIYEEQPIDENDDVDIVLDYTFEYERAIMNRDSLMFRENSDCNNDGQWTQAEDYDDVGSDGCPDVEEDGDGGCDGGGTGDDPNNDNWENGDDPVVKTEGNNEYNEGEPFSDREDNFIDAEIFWDENEDGERSPGEPYADLNCNGQYDDSGDLTGNGVWDDDEIFRDINNNGVWDDEACYIDINNNGEWDEGETQYDAEPLQSTSVLPDQIIINYDTDNDGDVDIDDGEPVVVIELDPDAINQATAYLTSEESGYHSYVDFIQNISVSDYQYVKYTPIEKIETIYSNEIIEDVPQDLISDNYYITKTYWETLPGGTDVDGDDLPDRFYDYDYHLFGYNNNGDLTKLVHPAYFYLYGDFWTPDQIEDGFYEIFDLVQDTIMYTVGGELRLGETVSRFEEITVDSNNDGVGDMMYEAHKLFEVESDSVSVPLRQYLGDVIPEGGSGNDCEEGAKIVCAQDVSMTSCIEASGSDPTLGENDCGEKIRELIHCSSDTTYKNVYKVIRTKNILMIGNGIEFGERNTVWLVPGIGIVMDKLEHRWTEDYWSEDEALDWKEFSRLELKSNTNSQESNLLGRLFNHNKITNVNEFQNEGSLNNDPYIPKPTGIIQRIRLPHE